MSDEVVRTLQDGSNDIMTMKFSRWLIPLILTLFMFFTLSGTALALDDDEYAGYRADTLEIDVGYFGGQDYVKHVFTLDEMNKMDLVTDDYTLIDNMPSVVIDHVKGVRLSDLLEASGIDMGSVQTFYFWTMDKTNDYYTSFTKTALIDTPRYCYYSLPDNFDSETGAGNEYATLDARRVDVLVALADDWNRCIAGATFGSDYDNLNTNTRFRLIYGQTDAVEHTADRSAKWIHKIVVKLGGAPTLTLDKSVLELKVGSVYRAEARVKAADAAITAGAEVIWSSSDESVATVDEKGKITVHNAGTAIITASLDGATASMTVTGSSAEATGGADSGQGGTAGSQGTAGQTPSTNKAPQSTVGSVTEIQTGDTPPKPDQSTSTTINQSPEQSGTTQNSILPENSGTTSDKGGVQNWRVYEMAPDAVALPVIKTDDPLIPVVGIITIFLFAGGIVFRILKFKHDLEDKFHVFIRKSQ